MEIIKSSLIPRDSHLEMFVVHRDRGKEINRFSTIVTVGGSGEGRLTEWEGAREVLEKPLLELGSEGQKLEVELVEGLEGGEFLPAKGQSMDDAQRQP